MKRADIKVRRGQVWKKKDTGRHAIIASRGKDTVKITLLPQCKTIHETRVRDLQMFWELVRK